VKREAAGTTIFDGEVRVTEDRLASLAQALGSDDAGVTARLVPYFGPTMAGERRFVEALGLDLSKALLGGVNYRWVRPFRPGETVHARVLIDKVFDKGSNRFGVVLAEYEDADGELIHAQTSTFIERQDV
jgi:hypothetical protein